MLMRRLSIVTCGLLVNLWVAPVAWSQAPVIDLSQGASSASGKSKSGTIEGRLSRIERLFENQTLVDLTLRLESMQQEMQRMFGEMEVISHEIVNIKRRQRDLYLDIDRRFQKLEAEDLAGSSPSAKSGAEQPGTGTVIVPIPPGVVDTVTGKDPSSPLSDEQVHKAAYQLAFGLLRESKYDKAKAEFTDFIAKYPKSDYAGNAQYWLGEVNYVQRNFGAAIREFNKVLKNYPDSSKYADALLKIGLSEFELEHWDLASNAFNKLIKRDPNSSEAQLAGKKLQSIKMQKKQ